jgi:biopolymer transport protein ExbB
MGAWQVLQQGDAVTQSVALVLLAMSVGSWAVILWKSWLLRRADKDIARACAAFWQAPSLSEAHRRVPAFDPRGFVQPLLDALAVPSAGRLAAAGERSQQLTRSLRQALHGVLDRLQSGQVLLATVGATAPFVGLLGTVWGIYHALVGIAAQGQISIELVAGPVGEALVMTAAGLAVAIPAVMGYNVFSRLLARLESELEGFALDLRDLLAQPATAAAGWVESGDEGGRSPASVGAE